MLGLVLNAIVLWNIRYMNAALEDLRMQGVETREDDVERLSPLVYEHISYSQAGLAAAGAAADPGGSLNRIPCPGWVHVGRVADTSSASFAHVMIRPGFASLGTCSALVKKAWVARSLLDVGAGRSLHPTELGFVRTSGDLACLPYPTAHSRQVRQAPRDAGVPWPFWNLWLGSGGGTPLTTVAASVTPWQCTGRDRGPAGSTGLPRSDVMTALRTGPAPRRRASRGAWVFLALLAAIPWAACAGLPSPKKPFSSPVILSVPEGSGDVGRSLTSELRLTGLSWLRLTWDAEAGTYRSERALALATGVALEYRPESPVAIRQQNLTTGQAFVVVGDLLSPLAPALEPGPTLRGPSPGRPVSLVMAAQSTPQALRGIAVRAPRTE